MSGCLSAQGEQEWNRLAGHLQWQEGFGLVFIFISHAAATDELRRRLDEVSRLRLAPLQVLVPQVAGSLTEEVIELIEKADDVYRDGASPLWLELNHSLDGAWNQAREKLLRRLNERRELLRSRLQRPLVLVLPEDFLQRSAQLAPDLWSIKLTCGWFQSDSFIAEDKRLEPEPKQAEARPATLLDQALWQEWQRLQQSPPSADHLRVAWQACEAAVEVGELDLAADIAMKAVSMARTFGDRPDSQRDLSISLNKIGKVAQARGRWDEAEAACRDGLELSRALRQRLGDTPQSLRDLSVSLDKIADVAKARGRWDEAEAACRESLELSRALRQRLGDTPQSLRDLSISLDKIAAVSVARGLWEEAEAPCRECLELCRELRQQLGDTPENLRDLCIALENVAGLHEQRSEWQESEKLLQEALNLWRRLHHVFPDIQEYAGQAERLAERIANLPNE